VDSSFFPFLVGTVGFVFVDYLVGHIHQKLELLVEFFLYGIFIVVLFLAVSYILE